MSNLYVIPAQAAGFVSLLGQITKNSGVDTLTIPEGMINIGGNSFGYLITANAAFNPLIANDGTFSALTLGDDIYIYACQNASGIATILASKNSTAPTGYATTTSRKLGGFHVGRIRGYTYRFDTSYAPITGIIPNSVWDLKHRPRCSPEGMAEIKPGLWGCIYLCSVISGAWPEVVFGSRYNAAPVRSLVYNELDLHRGLHAAGMREPTFEEWLMMAYGAPQGEASANNLAWTSSANTGPCNTGYVAKSLSCLNFVDTVGNLWENVAAQFDLGNSTNSYAWDAAVVNTGQDSAYSRGQVYHVAWRHALAGGYWSDGVYCGCRTLSTNARPWAVYGTVGVRGVSESI